MTIRIALAQMTSGIDPAANADRLRQLAARAVDGGAAMLFTPEMTGLLDRDRQRAAAHIVREEQDQTLAAACSAARAHGIWIALGSIAVRRDEAGNGPPYANRSLLVDANGMIRARYDKIHLFDVDLPTGESWRESASYAPGAQAVIAETPIGLMGLAICYDLRFPALFAALAEAGALAIAVPAAFTVPTGQAHWHVLLRARAIETGSYIIAAAQEGVHEDGRTTYGHALVIDPWGRVLLDLGAPGTGDGTRLGFADIDPQLVIEARTRIPALAHRRPFQPPDLPA